MNDEMVKKILAVVTGFLAAATKTYGVIFACVSISIVFDVATGVLASKCSGVKISSEKANKGFWKKVSLLASMFFGMFLDMFIPVAMEPLGIVIPFNMPFGLIFGCYIVFNEAISICENLDKSNPDMLPKWLKSLLKDGIDKIDGQSTEEEEDVNE